MNLCFKTMRKQSTFILTRSSGSKNLQPKRSRWRKLWADAKRWRRDALLGSTTHTPVPSREKYSNFETTEEPEKVDNVDSVRGWQNRTSSIFKFRQFSRAAVTRVFESPLFLSDNDFKLWASETKEAASFVTVSPLPLRLTHRRTPGSRVRRQKSLQTRATEWYNSWREM